MAGRTSKPNRPLDGPDRTPSQLRVFTAQRAEPLPAPDVDRAAKAKELAGELGFRVKRFLRDQWEDFKASDRYFKLKAAIIAGWVAISVGSVGVAASGGKESPAANDLGAFVKVFETSLAWSVVVENTDDDHWTKCKLTLNGAWSYEQAQVAPADKVTVLVTQFAKGKERPAGTEVPKSLRIDCDQGSVTPELVR